MIGKINRLQLLLESGLICLQTKSNQLKMESATEFQGQGTLAMMHMHGPDLF